MTHIRFALILLLAACAPPPPEPPAAKPAPETAFYLEWSYEALPGWPGADPQQSLQAFVAGCPRPAPLALACEQARLTAPEAARQFFESLFVPYAVINPDGGDSGMITG
jgi:membrane-bound lytic murein transglycosylase A